MLKTSFIGFCYKNILKPILFKMDPENVHDGFTRFGNFLGKSGAIKAVTSWLFNYKNPALEQKILGIDFPNPVGLSAGFDKDANLADILEDVGFGFMEIGTVTNKPYIGNPKPRLIRLPNSKALLVNYGLKNIGVDKVIQKVRNSKSAGFVKAISVGRTNSSDTAELDAGINDYFECFKKAADSGLFNFYEINLSCPNTSGGEPFTTPDKLTLLLNKLYTLKINRPVFLKMPVNLEWGEFRQLLDVAVKHGVSGVTISNLSKNFAYEAIRDEIPAGAKGGVSGKPTEKLSNDLISKTYKEYGGKLLIIGVGGIFSAEDAYEKIKRGASLLEIITGMIYNGPQVIGEINRGLVELLKKDGYENISQAIGSLIR